MVSVSFPGLGIEQFTFDKVAFSIGNVQVRWYGIIIVMGIMAAFAYATMRAKQIGISSDDMYDLTMFTVIAGIIGARAYYVLTTMGDGRYQSFLDVIAVWNGGIAIYGALIGGAVSVFLVCRHKKLDVRKVVDCVSPGVQLAQAIGRWGNFFNGEAYGTTPDEGSPLYFMRMGLQHEGWSKEYFYQPCFLYESLWNLCGFIIINILYKKKKFDGQIFLMYIAWYGFGRMFIEGLRTDSLYVGVFRISQVIGFVCFVVGTVLIILGLLNAKKLRLAQGDYEPVYGKLLGERKKASVKAEVPAAADDNREHDTQPPAENTAEDSGEISDETEGVAAAETDKNNNE